MFSLKKSNYLIFLLNCFYLTLPTLFILILITLFKHSQTEYKLMCASLEFFYNQKCYMALTYTPRNLVTNMGEVKSLFSIVNLFRFIFIFILGFLPLFLLTYASSLRSSKIYTFFFNKVSFIYLILIFLLPTFFIYLFAIDWGRWIHISYSMSIIFFVYCLKNKIIYSNKNSSKKLNFFGIKNNFILIIVFILFALSWNHKTVMHEDIGSIPIYRALSKIYKWRNMEIFTSIDISRASKIYISSGPFFENK